MSASNAVPVVVMGLPTVHIPHGAIDEIMAMHSLDPPGIAAEVRKHI